MAEAIIHARLPEGGRFATWKMPDGWPVRTARWPGKRGTLVVANGRGDFIEKYGEAYRHWHARGWSVLAFDWRGQGGSGRIGATPCHGAPGPFSRWTRDLGIVIGRAAAEGPLPIYGIGHSMGGHLMLRALVEGEARLRKVALCAPMLGIATGALPGWSAAGLAAVADAAGLGAKFAPGQGPARDPLENARRASVLTHDEARATEEYALLDQHPELALGGPTWGWLADAYRSIRLTLAAGGLEMVRTPVLAVLAGDERVVRNSAAKSAVARLPRGEYAEIAGGAHELWREADGPRVRALAAIDAFLERE